MRDTDRFGKPTELIDWKDKDAKEQLEKALKELVDFKTIVEINIKNIVSNEFVMLCNVEEPTDFNGWECDWWSYMYYNEVKVGVGGGAFYGTISLSVYKEY